eukprot:6891936-Prymnesium_polylepis.1
MPEASHGAMSEGQRSFLHRAQLRALAERMLRFARCADAIVRSTLTSVLLDGLEDLALRFGSHALDDTPAAPGVRW